MVCRTLDAAGPGACEDRSMARTTKKAKTTAKKAKTKTTKKTKKTVRKPTKDVEAFVSGGQLWWPRRRPVR